MSVYDRRTRSFAIGLVSDSVFKDRCRLARPGRRSVAEGYPVGQDLFHSVGRARGELSTGASGSRQPCGWRNVLVGPSASRSFVSSLCGFLRMALKRGNSREFMRFWSRCELGGGSARTSERVQASGRNQIWSFGTTSRRSAAARGSCSRSAASAAFASTATKYGGWAV
jgi:hypothetical protein